MIALSILFLAAELAHHRMGKDGLAYRAPWIVAFSFGLLHGFGFAGALAQVGLSHADIPRALLFFNLGVEAGQLGFVAVILGLIYFARKLQIRWPAWSLQIPSYAIGCFAALLFLQRCALIFS
jgi:HupE / UreJ protein